MCMQVPEASTHDADGEEDLKCDAYPGAGGDGSSGIAGGVWAVGIVAAVGGGAAVVGACYLSE
jgi:hypothetical protein